jgi:Methyltransferase domain
VDRANPWLEIPLADYEGHMALPQVGQAGYLAGTLERLVREHSPASVAVAGCAGGNGLRNLAAMNVPRVVGIDINPAYLAEAKRRYSGSFTCLELVCCDIASDECAIEPVDFIFAALIFEFAGLAGSLAFMRRLARPGAMLAAILQLPHPDIAAVSPSPFASVARLGPAVRLIPAAEFHTAAEEAGFAIASSVCQILPSGKAFQEILMGVRAEGAAPGG